VDGFKPGRLMKKKGELVHGDVPYLDRSDMACKEWRCSTLRDNNVREVRIADYPDIYVLNQHFNPNLSVFTEEKVKEKLVTLTTNTKDLILVYEQNNEVIGYIHGSPYELLFSDSLVNVLGFVVKKEYRSQGIGHILIECLEQWAKTAGYSGIKLLSHPSRVQAHNFYERRGYKFTKDQKNFIKTFGEN
jgi:predicted N-acetyltransferase YhbS